MISPLLALMQNQVEAAEKIGLSCDVLNSTVKDRKADILQSMAESKLDLVLITPETLFSEDVQKQIGRIAIGLFVIDEAHARLEKALTFLQNDGYLYKESRLLLRIAKALSL